MGATSDIDWKFPGENLLKLTSGEKMLLLASELVEGSTNFAGVESDLLSFFFAGEVNEVCSEGLDSSSSSSEKLTTGENPIGSVSGLASSLGEFA